MRGLLTFYQRPFHEFIEIMLEYKHYYSYTLGREYRVVGNQYSRLLFIILCVQQQSTNITSQYQYLAL